MKKDLLRKESKKIIQNYVNSGILKPSQITKLWMADDYQEIITAIKHFIDIDVHQEQKIWNHIINHVWQGVIDDEQKDTVFNEHENIFIKELLKK